MSRANRERRQNGKNKAVPDETSRESIQREQFLARLRACKGKVQGRRAAEVSQGYQAVVFQAQVIYHNETGETRVFVGKQDLGSLPYVTVDVTDFHHLIASDREFDAQIESTTLNRYVGKLKQSGDSTCHFEAEEDGFSSCGAAITCPFRTWNAEQNLPQCAR